MHWFILSIYAFALCFVLCYSLTQLQLVYAYYKNKKRSLSSPPELTNWPKVTVQLPLYNELYVTKRLIQNISKLDYPSDLIEIQLLDDSDDDTTRIAQETIDELGDAGTHIEIMRRPQRSGYKAGALKYGMNKASGEFIAIFDADFLPDADFLKKTIPHFYKNQRIGVVQTKWGHLNKDFNLLTKCQAFGLDAHFSVEQVGRNSQQHFINFNGTGGVWRKSCITDAGNWQADTLTEDLDLSYRAQLKGWEFVYLENITAPAELPITMTALKSQQFRWTKGAAENTRKNLIKVLRSPLPLATKLHASFHLMNSLIFICVLICSFLSVPVLLIKSNHQEIAILFKIGGVFITALLILALFYATSYFQERRFTFSKSIRFIIAFPTFLGLSMGLSIHNSIAVFEGFLGKKSPFVRTPKFNVTASNKSWKRNIYRVKSIGLLTLLEGFAALYFLYGIWLSITINDFTMIHLFALLFCGYSAVFIYSIKHASE